jgi:hypothetical protein
MNEEKLLASIGHTSALLESFGDSMEGWEFTGEVIDTGKGSNAKCGCGHALRYEYIWKHDDGRTNITGSTCVEKAAFISEGTIERMQTALEDLKKRQAEARRKAKLASETEAVVAKLAVIKAKILTTRCGDLVERNKNDTGYVDLRLYNARKNVGHVRRMIREALALKTPKGQLRRLETVEKALETWLD